MDTGCEDTTCGVQLDYGCCSTRKRYPLKFLQRFATSRWTLFSLCCLGFFQGFVVNGLMNSVITTIEKRFGLQSAETGFLIGMYDIASMFATAIVMYLGGRGHKPLWIGWGMTLMGLGCILSALPHFVAPRYTVDPAMTSDFLCASNATGVDVDRSLRGFAYFLYIGHFLNGLGAAALYTLCLTYLDENVQQKYSSLYHGIFFSVTGATGPAVGYVVGGALLKVFTNVGEKVTISSTHASWIGAWWPGYLTGGVFIFVFSIPILLLPRNLPGTEEIRKNREKERYITACEEVKGGKTKLKDKFIMATRFYKEFIVLLCNPPYLFMTFANCMDAGLIDGFSTFSPKYLEVVFGVPATESAFYVGLVTVVGGVVCHTLGGLIVAKANLKVRGIIKLCIFLVAVSILSGGGFFLHCREMDFAGATIPYTNHSSTSPIQFTSSCNAMCDCNSDVYDPVCGDNDVTYFSPCFAGCQALVNETYYNCSCVFPSSNMTATTGTCTDKECINVAFFLVTFFFLVGSTLMCWTPNVQAVIRIVPFSHRSIAVGLQWILNRLIGGTPVPIIMGRLMDVACTVWSTEGDVSTSCRRYNNRQMALYLFLVLLIAKSLAMGSYALAFFIYRRQKLKQHQSSDLPKDAAIAAVSPTEST